MPLKVKENSEAQGILDVIDYIDRPGDAFAKGTYANAGTYAHAFEDIPGKCVPKAGAVAEAGVGRARAEYSIFEAEAKGPNASAGATANILGAKAMASAEIASASASAGPVAVKVGLGLDTGVSVGVDGAEVKLAGCGVSLGRKVGISVFGSELSVNLW